MPVNPSSSSSKTSSGSCSRENESTFESFFEAWLVHQEHYLDELLSVEQNRNGSNDEHLRELTDRVLTHYHQYYKEKSRAAQENIFTVMSPPWFSSFERACLWISGFNPGIVIKLARETVKDLTEDQEARITKLMKMTKAQEKMLTDEFARVQEYVACPPLLDKARMRGRGINGVIVEAQTPEMIKSMMQSVVANADMLRLTTTAKMTEILAPVQNVRFLTAATQLQLRIRSLGTQRDAEMRELND